MNIGEQYKAIYRKVQDEHEAVFKAQDIGMLEDAIKAIVNANRIFTIGVGREGIAMRAFSMRLMHLGKEVHWIWDDTTPGMGKGDLLLAVSGSGKIGHIHYVAEKGKQAGATLYVVTGTPGEMTPSMADCVLFVPAYVFNGTDPRCVPSVQPMGALFEQHCFMLYDILIMMLEEAMRVNHAEMESRHRNVE